MKLIFVLLSVALSSCANTQKKENAALRARVAALEAHSPFLRERENKDPPVIEELNAELKQGAENKKILTRLSEDAALRSQNFVVEIAQKYAGTPQEAFGKERALYHARQMDEIGGLPFGTPESFVDGFFKAARQR